MPSSLKSRLTMAVMLLVALCSALVAAVALEIVYRAELETTGQQQYRLITSAGQHLESELNSKRLVLRAMADLLRSSHNASSTWPGSTLAQYTGLLAAFSDVAILDTQGMVAADLNNPASVGRGPFIDRAYFKATLKDASGVISAPMVSSLSRLPVVLVTEPVFDPGGKISHVIAGSINLADPAFFGRISGLGAGSTGYLFALTRDGLVLHHPDPARLTRNVKSEAGKVVAATQAAMDGWEGWTLGENKKGVPAILTYKQMHGPGWILGSVYPAEEAFSGITRARRYGWLAAIVIAVLAGMVGRLIILYLLRPLRLLQRQVQAIEHDGAGIALLDTRRDDEVGALGRAFHSLSIKQDLAERRLRVLSYTDTLTGLGNRRQFDQDVTAAVALAIEGKHALAIAYLDIDDFKLINDTYGHAVGDAVLKEFARRLKDSLRPSDQPFRLAGDEFVIILERIDVASSVNRLADRLLLTLRRPFDVGAVQLLVTTSMGFVISRPPIVQIGDLLQHADAALYKSKRAGRDTYTVKELGKISEPVHADLHSQ